MLCPIFEPFDPALRGTQGPECVEGLQRVEFLTGFGSGRREEWI